MEMEVIVRIAQLKEPFGPNEKVRGLNPLTDVWYCRCSSMVEREKYVCLQHAF